MVGNTREETVERPLAYAEVEAALAKVDGAEGDVQRTTFRARVKHFKRLGIPRQNPGKGRRIRYTNASEMFQMMLALEFSEFGVDPYLIVDILKRHWRLQGSLFHGISYTQFFGANYLIVVEVRFMSGRWKQEIRTATKISFGESSPVVIHCIPASDKDWVDKLEEAGEKRFLVFNLSQRVREVEQALKSVRE
jgi:hypothetical protein